MISRRKFLGIVVAAPAIVRAPSLMRCSGIIVPVDSVRELVRCPGNRLLTVEMIVRDALMMLEQNMVAWSANGLAEP